MSLSKSMCGPCSVLFRNASQQALNPCGNIPKLRFCQRCNSKQEGVAFCINELNILCESCDYEHQRKRPFAFHYKINISDLIGITERLPFNILRYCKDCKTCNNIESHMENRHKILDISIDENLKQEAAEHIKLCDNFIRRMTNRENNRQNKNENFLKTHEKFIEKYYRNDVNVDAGAFQHMNYLKQFGENVLLCENALSAVYLLPHFINAVKHSIAVYEGNATLPTDPTPLEVLISNDSVLHDSTTVPKQVMQENMEQTTNDRRLLVTQPSDADQIDTTETLEVGACQFSFDVMAINPGSFQRVHLSNEDAEDLSQNL